MGLPFFFFNPFNCLLTGVFSSFTFTVIINKYVLIAIFYLFFGCPLFFLFIFPYDLTNFFSFMLVSLSLFLHICYQLLVFGYHEVLIYQPIYQYII